MGEVTLPSWTQQGQKERGLRRGVPPLGSTSKGPNKEEETEKDKGSGKGGEEFGGGKGQGEGEIKTSRGQKTEKVRKEQQEERKKNPQEWRSRNRGTSLQMNQVLSFSMESNKSRRGHVTTLEHCHMVALGSFLKGTQKPWVGLPTSKQHFLNMQPALLPGVPEVTGVTNEVYINWSSLTCVLRFSYLFHNSKGQGGSVCHPWPSCPQRGTQSLHSGILPLSWARRAERCMALYSEPAKLGGNYKHTGITSTSLEYHPSRGLRKTNHHLFFWLSRLLEASSASTEGWYHTVDCKTKGGELAGQVNNSQRRYW